MIYINAHDLNTLFFLLLCVCGVNDASYSLRRPCHSGRWIGETGQRLKLETVNADIIIVTRT